MKKIFTTIISFLLVGLSCSKINQSSPYPKELSQLHDNVVKFLKSDTVHDEKVASYLSGMDKRGKWTDINYKSQARSAWPVRNHLIRLRLLALAYQSEDSKYYHNAEVLNRINLALSDWLKNDYTSLNWWHPQIGIPMELLPTLILMEQELSEVELKESYKILDRAQFGLTGQNKVWLAGNVLLTSLLKKDVETVQEAARQIQEELIVSDGEGLQPDWSYHQHGAQIQFGNYGLAYVADMVKWINLLKDTPFEFDSNKIKILRSYLLEGLAWVSWKDRLDISACGRQLFPGSQTNKAASISNYMKRMAKIDPEFKDEYKKTDDYSTQVGNKHFWRSDYHIHRTKDFYLSIKMCSERVLGAESCNLENIQGYYMGDGATYLYQSGDEYLDIFPYWNWKKIPGTTTHQDNDTLPVLTSMGYHNGSDFVGGVSDDKFGIATMNYNRDGLTAHKSWFILDDQVVCLGAAINSSENIPVATTLNQSFYKGEIKCSNTNRNLKGSGEQSVSCDWLLHDNIGYLFPESTSVNLAAEEKDGSWNWVAKRYPEEIIQAEIFTAWIDHGKNPENVAYAYVLVPNATEEKLEKLTKNPSFEITNAPEMQQVMSSSGDFAGLVFYEAGKTNLFGGFEVSHPCIVLVRKKDDGLVVSVAEPSHNLYRLRISFNGTLNVKDARHQNGQTVLNVDLPQGREAGKTVTINVNQSIENK